MLMQSLRALCLAPGGSGSLWKYIEVLVRSPRVSGRIACGILTELHFADRQRVQDAEAGIMQALKDLTTTESTGATTRNSNTLLEEMLNAISDILTDLASSNNEQAGKDEEQDVEVSELGNLNDDDEPGWVMGTFSITVQHPIESVWQKRMRLNQ